MKKDELSSIKLLTNPIYVILNGSEGSHLIENMGFFGYASE